MSQSPQRRLSTIFEPPDLSVEGELVSHAEVEFFKTHGFLFKPGLIEAAAAESALDRVWDCLIKSVPLADGCPSEIDRDKPDSWRDPPWAKMPPADKSGPFEGRQRTAVHGHTVKMHEIGGESFLVDLVVNHEPIRAIAQAMLAEKLKVSERTRGVYAIFPPLLLSQDDVRERISGNYLGPHTDRVCQQLNVCVYLDNVPPRSGGFTVYPGSHQIMYGAHHYEANWSPNDSFRDRMREVIENITPVEFVGNKGDVVFWHGRCVHSAGVHVGDSIRWAVFADFTEGRDFLSPDDHRALGQFEWFKDAKLFAADRPVSDNMWESWRLNS